MYATGPRVSRTRRSSKRASAPKPVVQTVNQACANQDDMQFSTFVNMLQKAGLSSVLNSTGPLTVLAPTNAAFAKVDPQTLAAWAKNPDALRRVLLYHVVSGRHPSDELVRLNGKSLTTVQGDRLPIQVVNGQLKVGNATIVRPDVKAMNGVIHVIDTVLIPGAQNTAPGSSYQAVASAPAPSPVPQDVNQTGQAVAQGFAYQSCSWVVWLIIIIIIVLLLVALFTYKPKI